LCFGEQAIARTLYRVHGRSWVEPARMLVHRHGLVVVAETQVPTSILPELLRMPNWVAMRVDLGDSDESFRRSLSTSAREDLKRIRRHGFVADVSHDASWADEFHDRFHRPAMAARHGADGYVLSAPEIATMVRDAGAEFVRLHYQGQVVGALLCEPEALQYATRRIGWRDGDPTWPRMQVIPALYAQSMQRARALGYRAVQLGGTPPWLEDGLFQFKSKWNAALDRSASVWGEHHAWMTPSHATIAQMLAGHSIVIIDGNDGFAILSAKARSAVAMSPATSRSIGTWYRLAGNADAARAQANASLPAALRPWFVREES
jgi:hypothetical protein